MSVDSWVPWASLIASLVTVAGGFRWWRGRNAANRGASLARPEKTSVALDASNASNNTNTQTVNVNVATIPAQQGSPEKSYRGMEITDLKRIVKVLFIDDLKDFKMVPILKKMGWANVRIVPDVASLEHTAVLDADVIFVDIQGVGAAMEYSDEGLGLALGLKRRHPSKKVVIYSAYEEGGRFHEGLREADYTLAKTSEPVRFEEAIVRVVRK